MTQAQNSASWASRLAALGRDRRSGAAQIALRARAVLVSALRAGVPPERLAEAGVQLLSGQPAMAPLYRAVNDACLGKLELRGEARRSPIPLRAVLPARHARVLTYSASATVQRSLVAARAAVAEVICSEGRPGGEGVRLARALGRAGLPVRLLTDAALFGRVGEVDLILVGADALTSSGVVNKVGTSTLATLARHCRRPFYVIAGTDKILPARFAPFFGLSRPGSPLAGTARGARAENPMFDLTPYELVRAIVTERGRLSRKELSRRMRSAEISEALLQALRRQLG